MECDCRLKWVVQWVAQHNLQVTSRERNPQFCGRPDHLHKKSFANINLAELVCDPKSDGLANHSNASIPSTTLRPTQTTPIESETSPLMSASSLLKIVPSDQSNEALNGSIEVIDATSQITTVTTSSKSQESVRKSPLSRAMFGSDTVKIIDAFFQNNSITIEWEPTRTNSAGYQVVYRFFGSRDFKKGPLMPPNQRRYRTSQLPLNECVVICVLSLDDHSFNKLNNIPLNQCREIRRERNRISDLDKVVIGISAAVCAFVVAAVFVFICCYHRSRDSSKTASPLGKSEHEWETVSVYSTRSIPRARMYHMDSTSLCGPNHMSDETRSHISNCYQLNPYTKHRSIADGQSNRSYSMARSAQTIGDTRELTKSHQSLSMISGQHCQAKSHKKQRKKGHHSNSGLISANSVHSLNEYDSDWNYGSQPRVANWKDNEVDIYVDQNYVISTNNRNKYLK